MLRLERWCWRQLLQTWRSGRLPSLPCQRRRCCRCVLPLLPPRYRRACRRRTLLGLLLGAGCGADGRLLPQQLTQQVGNVRFCCCGA